MKKQKHHCIDCGGAPVNHFLTYTSILLGVLIEPWTNWLGKLIPESSFDWSGPLVTKSLAFLRLGKITYEPKDDDSGRTRVLWEEAIRRGIKMYEFHLGPIREIFVAEFKDKKITFEGLPRGDGEEAL